MTELKHVTEYIPRMWKGKRNRVTVITGPETIVEQCHEEDVNINKIIARYARTGSLPPASKNNYMDVSNIGDLMDVKLKMQEAMSAYAELPESITGKFNDADEFLEYVDQLEGQPEQKKAAPEKAPEKVPQDKPPETPETPPATP